MRRAAKPSLILFAQHAFGAVAWAQPQVGGVVSAADYTPTLSPGSIAAIFGTELAPSITSASSIPLPTLLNTASVSVNGRQAPLFYVSATQINFQIPFATSAGVATLTVSRGGLTSRPVQFVVAAYAPGIFGYGGGRGVIQNQDYSINSSTNPAAGGSFIIVYLTGTGATDLQIADGDAAPASPLAKFPGTAAATIGDADAPVLFMGLTPGSVGLAQANLQVPALPTGTYPLRIALNGYQNVSALVSVSGSRSGFQVTDVLSLVSSFSLPGVGPTVVPGISGIVGNSAALFANTLYVCSPSDIKVVDVTNPAAPNYLRTLTDPQFGASAHNCTVNASGVAKPFLTDLIRSSQSIAVFNLSNPAMPLKTTQRSVPVLPRSVAYSGNIGFFGENVFSFTGREVTLTRGNISAVDFSNLSAPAPGPLVRFDPLHPETNTTNLRTQMIVPAPGLLYAASTTASGTFSSGMGALDIFDTTNPNSIQGAGQILVPTSKVLLTVTSAGSELLAVGDTTGYSPGNVLPGGNVDFPYTGFLTLTMFDITDLRRPRMQGNIIVRSMRPGDCGGPVSLGTVFLGNGLYALTCRAPDLDATGGSGNGSLIIVDGRDPQNPQAYTYGTLPGLGGIVAANGYLYVAVGSGANIYKIQLP